MKYNKLPSPKQKKKTKQNKEKETGERCERTNKQIKTTD
jgi:hypothetical protein